MKKIEFDPVHSEQQPEDWTKKFQISDEVMSEIANPEWVYENLVIRGHILALPGAPGAGKTTIMNYVSCELVNQGFRVIYVNCDVSGGDAKYWHELARTNGIELLLPNLAGLTMDDVIVELYKISEDLHSDYSKHIFVFDTLKKMTDVINKNLAKKLYSLFRALSAKGITIILLAHTNKYKDSDGEYIYEGTGDLKSDCDDMVYLIPSKNSDGSMTVSTRPSDKVRGAFKPITFTILPDRSVRREENFIDTAKLRAIKTQLDFDQPTIEAINAAIEHGHERTGEIKEYCKDSYAIGWRTVKAALDRYSNKFDDPYLWEREKLFKNGAIVYRKVPPRFSGKCVLW